MNWYYAQGDQRHGPVTETEFAALIAAGTITETTLVWKDGMANWLPLHEARAAGNASPGEAAPAGWIRCTATGRYFPPEEIVYLDGKPYSAAAKPAVLQGVVQTGSLPSADFGRNGPPWENRAELGFFPAAWQTIKGVLFEPTQTFDQMKRVGGLGSPLLFNVLTGSLGTIVAICYNFVFNFGMQGIMPEASRQQFAVQAGANTIAMLFIGILSPLLLAVGAFIVSGVLQLSLMLCSGARQPFETTFRTNCYAYGATALFQLLPICGGFIAPVWWIVAMCIGLARTQEITGGRSTAAVLLPVVLCCVAILVFYGVLIAFFVSAMQGSHH